MFWQSSLLDETVGWLRAHDYRVVELDAESWSSEADIYQDLGSGLHFPDYFGHNMAALNDCMRDIAAGDYGWDVEHETGVVIVLKRFDAFAKVDRRTAQTMLDIVAVQARCAILIGNRMICLVQSNDPHLAFEPVGAMPVMWNDAEWLDAKRGL